MENLDELEADEKEYHVYLLLHGWEYAVHPYGGTFYVAPFETTNLIYGRMAAMRIQRKNERGEDCARD